jgi:hypothetical protein
MADTLSTDEARQQFRSAIRGRGPQHREPSLIEAKARLQAADAGLDLGLALRFISRGEWRPALFFVTAWSVTAPGRAYLAPVLLRGLEIFSLALGLFQKSSPAPFPENHTAASSDTDNPEKEG